MSQQGGSSMVSSSIPNSEVKYQKALKQISKLINTNKILKGQCEERQQILSAQLSDIAMRCEELQKKYEQSEHEKRRMQQFMQELQDTNQDLRKQYQTLERQVVYLNDVLTEQNAELKKLSVFKNEKGISQLFRSYQEREDTYRKEISRLEDHIVQLKTTIDRIEYDLVQQTEMRQRYEDQYNIIGMQINKYRELNNYLMDKNEHILGDERNRTQRGSGNQQEIQSLVVDMKRQLEMLRNVKYENQDVSEKQYIKNYELLMEEKNHLALALARVKDQLTVSEHRIKENYDIEERMSTALARSDLLIEENNMLKNKITILESKEIIDSAGFDEDSDLKVFEDKINYMMAKNDPAEMIRNGDDNTHFITMKSFITDLQVKLQTVIEQKQAIEKKYRSIKLKFGKKAEENIILEEANKLLKGKLQGFERLTEKLNYELQRSIQAHEDEIIKMVAITNNLVGKKVEESKTASAFIKSQFDIELEKAERAEKTLTQELQTLRLENSTLRIKLTDLQEKQRQSAELTQIIQAKLSEMSTRHKQLQQQSNDMNQKAIKFEQLYQEQKARHETILLHKQSVSSKLNLITEQFNEKSYTWEETIRQRECSYEGEIKRARLEIEHYEEQLSLMREENKRLSFELDQYRSKQTRKVGLLREENSYMKQIQGHYQQGKKTIHLLESELISLRSKLSTVDDIKEQLQQLQTEVMRKNDELNDERRVNIELKNEVESFVLNNSYSKQQNEQLAEEISVLKAKLYQPPVMTVSTSREIEARRTIQGLHEEIAVLESALRDERRSSARHLVEMEHYKEEISRLEDLLNKNKHREQSLLQTIATTNNELIAVQDELFQFRSRYNQSAASNNNLGAEVERAAQKIVEVTEQINAIKTKLNKTEIIYQHLLRDLHGTKHYIQEAEKMVRRLNNADRLEWEQQREKDNLASLIDTFNRILKNAENVQFSNTSSNQEYNFMPASSFGNIQNNFYAHSTDQNYARINFVGGSFGNQEQSKTNIVTNDTFKYPGSSIAESIPNVNFSSDSFGRPSGAGFSYSPIYDI